MFSHTGKFLRDVPYICVTQEKYIPSRTAKYTYFDNQLHIKQRLDTATVVLYKQSAQSDSEQLDSENN